MATIFLCGDDMKERTKQLRAFARAIRKRINDNDITLQRFAELHCEQFGLQLGTLNRYIYAHNVPGILMCWAIADSLSDMTKEPVDVVFMELAHAIRNKKTPD